MHKRNVKYGVDTDLAGIRKGKNGDRCKAGVYILIQNMADIWWRYVTNSAVINNEIVRERINK